MTIHRGTSSTELEWWESLERSVSFDDSSAFDKIRIEIYSFFLSFSLCFVRPLELPQHIICQRQLYGFRSLADNSRFPGDGSGGALLLYVC